MSWRPSTWQARVPDALSTIVSLCLLALYALRLRVYARLRSGCLAEHLIGTGERDGERGMSAHPRVGDWQRIANGPSRCTHVQGELCTAARRSYYGLGPVGVTPPPLQQERNATCTRPSRKPGSRRRVLLADHSRPAVILRICEIRRTLDPPGASAISFHRGRVTQERHSGCGVRNSRCRFGRILTRSMDPSNRSSPPSRPNCSRLDYLPFNLGEVLFSCYPLERAPATRGMERRELLPH